MAFREPTHRFGPGHRGVDLAAEAGAAVLASAAGTVVFAGALAGRGVVSVQHPDGLRTTYEPVAAVVTRGTSVAAGTVLGSVVAGHRACRAACLHWGVRRERGSYLDPLLLLMPRHVRLLPVPGPLSAGELGEPDAQPGDEPAVQLADPRLGDAEHPADLGEGAVLQVVQPQHQPVAVTELRDRAPQQPPGLLLLMGGCRIGPGAREGVEHGCRRCPRATARR